MSNQKMPRAIKQVQEQIEKHPKFKEMDFTTRMSFETVTQFSENVSSYIKAENNKWLRDLWNTLYL